MADAQSDYTFDLSALDPDTITLSSTPRRGKAASTVEAADHGDKKLLSGENHANANASAYSIHLSTLDPGSASSTLNLDREITRLESEDIGGPSDFTQNLAEWINGAQGLKEKARPEVMLQTTEQGADALLAASAKHTYRSPSVEDCTTPLPTRHVQPMPSNDREHEEKDEIDSASRNSADTPARSDNWQSLCAELQRKNDELNDTIQKHRAALREMARAQKEVQSQTATQANELREQLRVWQRGTTRSLGDSATLGQQQNQSISQQPTIPDLLRSAHLALVNQQKRIEELEASNHEMAQQHEARAADSDTREQRLQEALQIVQDRASRAEREAQNLRQHAQKTELERKQSQDEGRSNDHIKALHSEIDALKQRALDQKSSHEAELSTLRAEYQSVAADVDEWVVTKVQEKEERFVATVARRDQKIADLQARNDELERIYALCGKELMLAWGREEFGAAQVGQKQRYRYRHAVQGTA